jgi:hypothetical protein
MGQVVYPTWAALSPPGEGSRHGRNGPGEGPRQAGQVFRCGVLDVCHVCVRAPVSHELNEKWWNAHAMRESGSTTPEAVTTEHRRIYADLAEAMAERLDEETVREGRRTPGPRGDRKSWPRGGNMWAHSESVHHGAHRVKEVARDVHGLRPVDARVELIGLRMSEGERHV